MPPPLEGADFHNPDLTGPRKTPAIPSGGLFSAYARVKIAAPPRAVYDALLDVGDWEKWNRAVTKVRITKTQDPHARSSGSHKRIAGGSCMVFNVTFEDGTQTQIREVATLVEKLKLSSEGHGMPCVTRIRWRLDNAAISTPGFLFKAERVNEIEERSDGSTVYRSWHTFNGPVAKFLRKKLEPSMKIRTQFFADDLKTWVEKNQREILKENEELDETPTSATT